MSSKACQDGGIQRVVIEGGIFYFYIYVYIICHFLYTGPGLVSKECRRFVKTSVGNLTHAKSDICSGSEAGQDVLEHIWICLELYGFVKFKPLDTFRIT